MPDLSLKNLDEWLMRDVRVAAARSDMTLRDWVIAALIKSSRGNGKVERKEVIAVREATRPKPEAAERPRDSGTEGSVVRHCRRCDNRVERDPKNLKYWKCPTCKRQLEDSEVK